MPFKRKNIMMKNEEIIKAKLEERLRIVALLRKMATILLQATNSQAADGYTAAIVKGFSDLIEQDEGPQSVPAMVVPPIDKLH